MQNDGDSQVPLNIAKTLDPGLRRDGGAVADSAYAVIPVRARIQA